jgi:hypothetical protein
MAKSTAYLYDINPTVLADMQYKQALEYKLSSANVLLAKLLVPHYSIRDYERIANIHRAIKFNQSLLSELKEPN